MGGTSKRTSNATHAGQVKRHAPFPPEGISSINARVSARVLNSCTYITWECGGRFQREKRFYLPFPPALNWNSGARAAAPHLARGGRCRPGEAAPRKVVVVVVVAEGWDWSIARLASSRCAPRRLGARLRAAGGAGRARAFSSGGRGGRGCACVGRGEVRGKAAALPGCAVAHADSIVPSHTEDHGGDDGPL